MWVVLYMDLMEFKHKEVIVTLPKLKQNHHFYLKACSILSNESDPAIKYKQAGVWITKLEEGFVPLKDMPLISAEALTKIALVNQDAMFYILSNLCFAERLGIKQLTRLANHSLKAALHILCGKHFLKKFGRDRLARNYKEARYHFINTLAQSRIESYNDQ